MKERSPIQQAESISAVNAAEDLTSFFSANATGGVYYSPRFFAYGLSQQGSSHIENGIPCQDANDLQIVRNKRNQFLITAVADGLGSCVLSHEGSRTAVQTATAYCAEALLKYDPPTDQQIIDIIRKSFSHAWDAIEDQAMSTNQLPFSFYTTLTLTVYDGEKLHIGHIGDGGVVVVLCDGTIALATKRHKGKSATSVYPLQSGENNWQFLAVEQPVAGFALATDGVLDSFVRSEAYNNLVYEPFLTGFLFRDFSDSKLIDNAVSEMGSFLSSQEYRDQVHDDITLFIVGNTGVLRKQNAPFFDPNHWDKQICMAEEALQAKLNLPQQHRPKPTRQPHSPHATRKQPNIIKTLYDYFVGGSYPPKRKTKKHITPPEKDSPHNSKDNPDKEMKQHAPASRKKRKNLHT